MAEVISTQEAPAKEALAAWHEEHAFKPQNLVKMAQIVRAVQEGMPQSQVLETLCPTSAAKTRVVTTESPAQTRVKVVRAGDEEKPAIIQLAFDI